MPIDDEKLMEIAVAELLEQVLKIMPQAMINDEWVVTIPVSDIRHFAQVIGHEISIAIINVATAFISNIAAEIAIGIAEGAKTSIQRWIASKID